MSNSRHGQCPSVPCARVDCHGQCCVHCRFAAPAGARLLTGTPATATVLPGTSKKPGWTIQDKEVFASNFCNGGIPVKPGEGFQLAR